MIKGKLGRVLFSRKGAILVGGALASALPMQAATASETATYKYDALGRLVQVNVSGGYNDGLASKINYDPAGNRSNYETTGAKPRSVVRKIIVIPLNGYTIIPLP